MTVPEETRVALSGCGRVAERGYRPAFALARGVRLVAVADPESSRCARAAPGVPSFGALGALLASVPVDAVVVASPPGAHLDDAAACAAAGVVALVEKPPGRDAREAAALTRLEPAPYVGFNRRFDPELARLEAAAAAVERVELALSFSYPRAGWRAYAPEGDVLLDVGPHLVDLALRLGGRALAVDARTLEQSRFELRLELERGTAILACDGERAYRELFEVRAPGGRPLARLETGGVARRLATTLGIRPDRLAVTLARQLEALAAAAAGAPPARLATALDGLAAMEAIDRARSPAPRPGSPAPL